MIRLFDGDSDAEIGEISEEQFGLMQESLVEETLDEYSYNIDAAALSALESSGAEAHVVNLLRRALGERTSMDVRFEFD
jgi:hypothetical protein